MQSSPSASMLSWPTNKHITEKNLRTQYGVVGDVECGDLELFKQNFRHPLAVLWGVPRCLSHHNGMLRRAASHFVNEGMRDNGRDCREVLD